jgi:iron complex outermembrane receptor protein
MTRKLLPLLVLLFTLPLSAATVRGRVADSVGQPVVDAVVSAGPGHRTQTDADGAFVLELPAGTHQLRVSHPGFQHVLRTVRTEDAATLEIALDPAFSETMVVSAIRAEEEAPVTKTDVPREEIERKYHGQDVPLLLRDAPSINAFSESGTGGSGYSYISLRGVNSSRINFTLDGVPLSDSEDMTTYFVDFPDLARSLESIQVQRGVGTSTFGAAAFAGSVNLESIALAPEQKTDVTVGAGSFGNRQATVGYHSGALSNGFSFYTRLSYLENEGYRDHSATEQRNIFFSGMKQVGEGMLKLTGFSGHEEMQSSYYATDKATLLVDPTNNPLRPEETDSFGYDLAQLQYVRPLSESSDMTASMYYQRGYGWFRLFNSSGEHLREYGLDGMLLGSMLTYSRSAGGLTTNYGVHVNRFKRDHTRDNLTLGVRNYANYGVKQEANAFAKATYESGRWLVYGDAQVRHAAFEYHGDVEQESIDWTFFNPKVGARFTTGPRSSVYASAGLATREPARNDMFLGEDNPPVRMDLDAVEPERLVDVEAGWTFRTAKFEIDANVYAMEFRNEIAATGEQSDIGLALRKNVDRSSRRGIELDAAWQALPVLRLRTTANFSRNRIDEWTQFYDVYDADWNWTGAQSVAYRDVTPLLTPSAIVNQAIEYTPGGRFSAGVTGRHIGRTYLDNTNDDSLSTPSYFLVDAKFAYAVTSRLRVSLQVNNVLDEQRIWPSGYSYLYFLDGAKSGDAYFYPQATRNAVVLLDFDY